MTSLLCLCILDAIICIKCGKRLTFWDSLPFKAFIVLHLIALMKRDWSSCVTKEKWAGERGSNPAHSLTSARLDNWCRMWHYCQSVLESYIKLLKRKFRPDKRGFLWLLHNKTHFIWYILWPLVIIWRSHSPLQYPWPSLALQTWSSKNIAKQRDLIHSLV